MIALATPSDAAARVSSTQAGWFLSRNATASPRLTPRSFSPPASGRTPWFDPPPRSQPPPTRRNPRHRDADVAQRLFRRYRRVVVQRDAHPGGDGRAARHPPLAVLGPEQAVDDDVAPVVDLVDEDAARHPEVMGALQLLVPDGADVFEPQPVIVPRVLAQRLLVHVEDGADACVALHVARHLPAPRKVRFDDPRQLLAGVVRAATRSGCDADSAGGVGVQIWERQVDIAD